MGKLVGFDIGENSVKMVYFSGRELKRAITAELPDAMVSNGRICPWTPWRILSGTWPRATASP